MSTSIIHSKKIVENIMHKSVHNAAIIFAFSFFGAQIAQAAEGYSPYSGTTSSDFQTGGKFDLSTDAGLANYNSFYPVKTSAQMKYNAELALQLNKGDAYANYNGGLNDLKLAFADIISNFGDIAKDSKLAGHEIFTLQNNLLNIANDSGKLLDLIGQASDSAKNGNSEKLISLNSQLSSTLASLKSNLGQFNANSDKLNNTVSSLTINSIVTTLSMPGDLLTSSIKFGVIYGPMDEAEKKSLSNMVDVGSAIYDVKNIYGIYKNVGGYIDGIDALKSLDKINLSVLLNNSNNIVKLEKAIGKSSYADISFIQKNKLKNELLKKKEDMLNLLKSPQERAEAIRLLHELTIDSLKDGSKDVIVQLYKQFSSNPGFASMWENAIKIADIDFGVFLPNKPNVKWATVTMQNQLSAVTNGGASHIGSASLYTGYNNQQPNANVNPNNTNNYQTQTGSQQTAYSTNSQAFQSSDWVMVTGNAAIHTGVGNSFGPIIAPDGGQIASLNNAGVQYTVITKDFFVPSGTKQVTLTFNGNFVTNEYPTFVGSQYNDYATVKIISPSGNVTPVTAFNQSLNSSSFAIVNGLPSPLMPSGGQTAFKAITPATINVANGGKVTVEVKVANVGDTAYPSAILLNKITLK